VAEAGFVGGGNKHLPGKNDFGIFNILFMLQPYVEFVLVYLIGSCLCALCICLKRGMYYMLGSVVTLSTIENDRSFLLFSWDSTLAFTVHDVVF
jgi:hypothetical protein